MVSPKPEKDGTGQAKQRPPSVGTFVKAPPWLYRPPGEFSPGFTEREVRAYLALREHQREKSTKGTIPSEKIVAAILGVSLSTVERAIRGLRAKGAVVVTARPGTSNRYDFPDILRPPTPVKAGDGGTNVQRTTPVKAGDGGTPVKAGDGTTPVTWVTAEPDTDEVDEKTRSETTTRSSQVAQDGQPLGKDRSGPTAGSGHDLAQPLGSAGSAGSPGPIAGGGSGQGITPGQDPGENRELSAANSKTHWSRQVAPESKDERYSRPLEDNKVEHDATLIADYALEHLNIPRHKRPAALKSARYLLAEDGKDFDEVRKVIKLVAGDPRYDSLYLVRRDYADILDGKVKAKAKTNGASLAEQAILARDPEEVAKRREPGVRKHTGW